MAKVAVKKRKKNIMQAVDMLKTLSHPLRLAILCDILEHGEMSVGDIIALEGEDYSQSQISQYLGILRDMGYVQARRDGQMMWYSIAAPEVKKIINTLHDTHCK